MPPVSSHSLRMPVCSVYLAGICEVISNAKLSSSMPDNLSDRSNSAPSESSKVAGEPSMPIYYSALTCDTGGNVYGMRTQVDIA